MSEPITAPFVIELDDVHKEFNIHEHQSTSLKEMVVGAGGFAQKRKTRRHLALRGLTFELGRGRALGVVGANGAGKSTLLKIVAGITPPTSGTVAVHGRVASLIELGAGFQPEFTGMENIFLQGRIYGLRRAQILERLDAIQKFAGLGDFIHSPIRRYSTGMMVRLGFAVALNVDADLLLVDEVLAVGDGVFQAQCFDAIREWRERGRSLLFVSHDLSQIERVADEVLWLEHGRARMFGSAAEVLPVFERQAPQGSGGIGADAGDEPTRAPTPGDGDGNGHSAPRAYEAFSAVLDNARIGTGEVLIRRVDMVDEPGHRARYFRIGDTPRIRMEVEVIRPVGEVELWIGIGNPEGRRVAIGQSGAEALPGFNGRRWNATQPGRFTVEARIAIPVFPPGQYSLTVCATPPGKPMEFLDLLLRVIHFRVVDATFRIPHDPDTPGFGDFPDSGNPAPTAPDTEERLRMLETPPAGPAPIAPGPRTPDALLRPPAAWEIVCAEGPPPAPAATAAPDEAPAPLHGGAADSAAAPETPAAPAAPARIRKSGAAPTDPLI